MTSVQRIGYGNGCNMHVATDDWVGHSGLEVAHVQENLLGCSCCGTSERFTRPASVPALKHEARPAPTVRRGSPAGWTDVQLSMADMLASDIATDSMLGALLTIVVKIMHVLHLF